MKSLIRRKVALAVVVLVLAFGLAAVFPSESFAATDPTCQAGQGHCNPSTPSDPNAAQGQSQTQTQPNGQFSTGNGQHKTVNDVCGEGDNAVELSIKVGCKGKGNPIADMTFAIIRILSDGVGLVVIASIIFGGIQYTGSRGDPQSTAMAVNRIRSSVFALIIFIFGYAILNYIIPAGFLQ